MVPELLSDSLRRYELRRRQAAHDGPPLRAVRLYRMEWALEPDGRNVDTPDRQRLLAEVEQPQAPSRQDEGSSRRGTF